PVIELRDVEEKPAAEGEEATAPDQSAAEETFEAPEKELVIEDSDTNELDFDRLDALSKDWEDAFNEDHKPSRNGIEEEGDKKHDAMQNMASRPQSLQEYLADQLGYLDITPEQAQLVRHVIAHIGDNGYLGSLDEDEKFHPIPLEDIARTYGEPVTVEQVE